MQFEEMKQVLIAAAERAGLSQYEIYYQMEESISAETLKDEISSFASSVGGGVCFRCIVDGKMGYASGELMTADAMETLVATAISNARCIDSEDEVFIFGGSPAYAKREAGEVKLTDAATVRDTALALQKAAYAASEKVGDGTQSVVLSTATEITLCNSNGLNLTNRVGMSGAYVAPVVRDGDDAVFDGTQFRSFLSTFSPVFSAKNAQHGLSLLAGKEGETVAASCVTVTDDPMREGCPMQTPFDGEGVATVKRNVIENGVLKTLLYDLTTAKKAGVESTGNGQKGSYASPVSIAPYNFGIAAGNDNQAALFAAVGNGVYITECKGFHAGANAVTGDFSIESAGFMIRDGKRAEPIKSFTVAGNFFDLLKQIDRLGNEIKWGIPGGFTVFGSPDVLVRGVSIAGK